MIAVVISEFNKKVMDGLTKGCEKTLTNFEYEKIFVPGAFEIPAMAKKCVESGKYNAVITLGCVIKGETDHYDYICRAVSNGMMQVTLNSNIPVTFGVLTCQNAQLAFDRSSDNERNKGREVAEAALALVK
tara:strand:- start:25 stop:417 length:393 start_codon:yes stop_codon:yes gene_type:complete